MGVNRVQSVGLRKKLSSGTTTLPPNPNPSRFEVELSVCRNNFTIAMVKYPDCTTFEGKKILLFKGDKRTWLESTKYLDPHFVFGTDLIARFKPDAEGMAMALQFVMK